MFEKLSKNAHFGLHSEYRSQETELYYLQSRYYDPQIGRFINADAFTSTGQGYAGNNMFAYCGNNPVSRVDSEGTCWNILGGALVGALVGAVSQMICNVIDSEPLLNDVADSMITGAIGGALTAAFPGASTVINVGMSVVESIKSDVEEGKNLPTIAVNAVLSAGFAAISSGDTVFSDKNIVGKTVNALMDILPGNHPKVKATAGKFLTETFEAVGEEISSGITEGVVINRIGTWSKNVCGLYTGDNESYEKFQQLLG